MPLETATYIPDLNVANPAHTDGLAQADSHMRLLKSTIKATFPNFTSAALNSTQGNLDSAVQRVYGLAAIQLLGGTAALPGLGIAGDADTGLYSPAPNTVGLATNGLARLGIDASGNVQVFQNLLVSGNHTITGTLSVTGAITGPSVAVSGAVTGASANISGTGTFGTVVGALPAGAIVDFPFTSAPTGWAACDGTSLAVATYPALFAALGYTFGGAGANFSLPDYRSRFRRHRDGGTLAGAVGNTQSPVNLTHTHNVTGTSAGASVGHTHDMSSGSATAVNIDHTHSMNFASGAMSANADHTHALGSGQGAFIVSINNGSLTSQGNLVCTVGSVSAGLTTSSTNLAHTHNVNGTTGGMNSNTTHGHAISGSTGSNSVDHTHTFNVTSGAQGDTNEARPYSATVLTCIKLFN